MCCREAVWLGAALLLCSAHDSCCGHCCAGPCSDGTAVCAATLCAAVNASLLLQTCAEEPEHSKDLAAALQSCVQEVELALLT
jgi:hypothetical protein